MRRWFGDCLRSYSPWALDLSNVDVLAVLCPLLLGLLSCSSLWGFFLCVVSVVEVVVLLFFRLLFFVVFLAAFPLLSGWCSCPWLSRWIPWLLGSGCGVVLPSACPSFPGFVFEELVHGILPISTRFRILPVFAAFSELRGARQVERFAACSFDICRE